MTNYKLKSKQLDIPKNSVETDITFNTSVSAYKVVTSTGYQADSNNLAHRDKVIGFTFESVGSGFSTKIKTSGEISNPSWSFNAGDIIFLNGTDISTSAPSTGFSQELGSFINSNTLIINIKPSILL